MENTPNGNPTLSDNYTNGNETSGQGAEANRSTYPCSNAQWNIPGILHYLQYEWHRFECERQQWYTERAELIAQLGILKGELMAHINLKNDLVRRIKMLEYCIKNERIKFHKLKYGDDVPILEANDDAHSETASDDGHQTEELTNGSNWKHGRQLLRQYLQEIGYTETIINVRSSRVRSLLGLPNDEPTNENNQNVNNTDSINKVPAVTSEGQTSLSNQVTGISAVTTSKQGILQQMNKQNRKLNDKNNPNNAMMSDVDATALRTYDFLNKKLTEFGGGNRIDEEDDVDVVINGEGEAMDSETEEVLAEFDFLSAHQTNNFSSNTNTIQAANPSTVSNVNCSSTSVDTNDGTSLNSHKNMDILDIGELAAISLNDEYENETGKTIESQPVNYRKTWNPRYLLKSHFDCVRCLRFHPTLSLMITASEDETIKIWDLNRLPLTSTKIKQAVAGMTIDLEPIYTYRGHLSPVLSLVIFNNRIYSGSRDGEILIWQLPNCANIDPYDPYDPQLALGQLTGHTDAVWSLVTMNHVEDESSPSGESADCWICSASADGTIRVWQKSTGECIKTITWDDSVAVRPTCLAVFPTTHESIHEYTPTQAPKLLAASFTDGSINVYDLQNDDYPKPVLRLVSNQSRVNAIVIHPFSAVIASAHEDRHIKFWDYSNGQCFHTMVAHLDEVSSLDCDSSGQYLLSGSHDCSVRLWNFNAKTCIQEITSHRKKFDEAILDVCFHPTDTMFASAGAEALAKVFV